MAKYSNTVEYNIRTTLDSSGIAKLKAELTGLQNSLISKRADGVIPQAAFTKTMNDIRQVEAALNKAFNGKLGMLNLGQFTSELTKGGRTLNDYYQSFSRLGAQGTRAFGQIYSHLTKIDTGMRQVSSTTDKIMNTFGNTFRWGIIASAFSGIMNTLHQSVQYVKDLDNSLTEIMMVSGISRDNMNDFAVQANEAAKTLGGTTVQMTEATKVFIQQGMSLEESKQMGEYSVHLANVSEQDSATTSDQLTAYRNAFNIDIDDMGNAISKLAIVANKTAADVEELSIASQKAASVAATVGVDMDQFAGHIATIESVTREAPENIGNGLKTIYSRIADVSLGETLDDGVNMGSFAKALEKVGVEVLDSTGELRNAGDIMEDTMKVWQDLTQTQKAAVAKTVAGRFQLARFEALMNRADIYEDAVNWSRAETGTDTYDRMQETYKDSMEGRLNTLTATVEGIFVKAFNTDDFYGLIDAAQALADTFDNLIQAIGGGDAALTALGAVLTKVFSKNIAQGIGNSVLNRQTNQLAKENLNTGILNAKNQLNGMGINTDNQYVNDMANNIASVQKNMGSFSQEQLDRLNVAAEKHISVMTEASIAENKFFSTLEAVETAIRASGVTVENNVSITERYSNALKRLAEAEADGVAYQAAQDELYKALESDAQKLALQLNDLANSMTKYSKSFKDDEQAMKQWQNQAKSINVIVKELAQSETVSSERRKELAQTSRVLIQIENGEITSKNKLTKAITEAGLKTQQFYESLERLGQEGIEMRAVLEQAFLSVQQLGSAAQVSSKEMQGLAEMGQAQNFANTLTNITSGTMSMIFAIQSIKGAIDAINNEELDPFEKLEQSLMGFSMAIAMAAPVIVSGGEAIADWGKQTIIAGKYTNALKTAIAAETVEMKKNAAGVTVMNAARSNGIDVAGRTQKAIAQELISVKGLTDKQKEAIIVTLGYNRQQAAQAGLAPIVAAGTKGVAAAMKDLAISIGTALAAAGPFIAIGAAVAAVVAGIVLSVKQAHDHYYRFDTALDTAKESLTSANEQLDVARERMDTLNEAIEKLTSDENPFEGLRRGTAEWTDALTKANQEILDLVDKYPELLTYIEHGENGELTISEEGLEEAKNITQRNTEGALVNVASQKIGVFEAERNKMMMDAIHRDFGTIEAANSTYSGVGMGGVWNTNDDAMFAQMETAANIAGRLIENGNFSDHTLEDALIKSGQFTEQQITQLVANSDALRDVYAGLEKNSAQLDQNSQTNAALLLSDDKNYQNMSANFQSIAQRQIADQYLNSSDYTLQSENENIVAAVKQFDSELGKDSLKTGELQDWAIDNNIFGEGVQYKNGKWYDQENQERSDLNDADDLYEQIRNAYIAQAIADNIAQNGESITKSLLDAQKAAIEAGGEDFAAMFAGTDENGKMMFNDQAALDFFNSGQKIDVSKLTESDWNALGATGPEDYVNQVNEYFKNHPAQLQIEMPKDTTVDFGEEEVSDVLKDSGVSEAGFGRISQAIYDDDEGYFQQAQFELPDQIKEAEKALENLGERTEQNADEYDKAANKLQALSDEYNNLRSEADDTAAANVRMKKGLDKLADSWEDISSILEDEANEGTIEWYESLGQLDEIMSDIVNIDVGTLSDDFYQGEEAAEHLAAIEDAANGDIEAIDKLRNYASQDIITHMEIKGIKGETAEEARAELLSLQQSLQATIEATPLKARADVDVREYTNKLNDMIMQGQITAEQASAALSSMGISGTMTTKDGTVQVPKISYRMVGNPEDVANGGSITIEPFQDGFMTQTVKVPQFTGTHYTGPGITGGVGGSNSGGGGGGGGSCFIAGTQITTQNGYKDIEKIQVNDIVLSYNEKLKINQYSIVLQTMIHDVYENIYTLYIKDEQLVVTGIHRFFVIHNNKKQWIEASELQINDLVLFADHTWHKIQNIAVQLEHRTVYNFEVSDNHNYYVGKNQVLAHNKGGGGGSGGGKGKTYEPKKKDYDKKEKDRYEKVNTALDKIDSTLDNITMDQDRLIGNRWIDNLNKETDLLKEQVPWYKEKLKIQKEEAKELRDQLGKDFNAQFGPNGQLLNYATIFDKLEKERRAAYERYNKATTEDAQNQIEKEIEAIEKKQEKFEEVYSRYDELWSKEIPETEKALKEIQDRLEDIAEEARKARREAAQQLKELRDDARETEQTLANLFGENPQINFGFSMNRIDDLVGRKGNGDGNTKALQDEIDKYQKRLNQATDKNMKDFYRKQIDALKRAQKNGTTVLDLNQQRLDELMKAYDQWMKTGKSNQFGENEAAMFEAMQEAMEDAADLASELQDAVGELKDALQDTIEMMNDGIEDVLDSYDAVGDRISYVQDMYEIIYGDKASQQQVDMFKKQAENEENRLQILERQQEIQKQITAEAKKRYDMEPNNKDAQEEYLDALAQERDIDGQILDTRKEIAEAYRDAKEAANELAVDNWLDNFNGVINGVNVPIEYMADQWERIQENEELYLDDLNKAYEIQKLQNRYQQMLNDATDPMIQQQITDQMNQQLAYLRDKTNLSKYDVEYANAQLEILQKTIALEDARAAKNQMKLRRDSQGNYQYVYARDNNKTLDAENELLDASMEAYNMSKEQQADVQDQFINKVQEMSEALRKAANDQNLSREQIEAIQEDIIEKGYEFLDAMGEQLSESQKNMIHSFIDMAEQMSTDNAEYVQLISDGLKEGTISDLDMIDDRFLTSVRNWIGDNGLALFRDEAEQTKEDIQNNIDDFVYAIGDANVAISTPIGDMKIAVDDVDNAMKDLADSTRDLYDFLEDKSGVIANQNKVLNEYQRALTDTNNKMSAYYDKWRKMSEELETQKSINTQLKTDLEKAKNGSSGSSNGTGGKGKGVGGTPYSLGQLAEGIAGNIWTYGSWGEGTTRENRIKQKFGKTVGGQIYDAVQQLFDGKPAYGYDYNPGKWRSNSFGNYYKKFGYSQFDTGGYTGEWGSDGKWAMLHQKELVLNADDTQNILAAVGAVRQITEQLKTSAFVNNIANTIGRASQNNIQSGNNIEQRVEITANFPNANSAEEIEKALLSISDTSYQYAYNKNDIPW